MPSAPASIANSAARTGSGRAPPRALRSVATWSTFTPRRRGEAFDIEDISRNKLTILILRSGVFAASRRMRPHCGLMVLPAMRSIVRDDAFHFCTVRDYLASARSARVRRLLTMRVEELPVDALNPCDHGLGAQLGDNSAEMLEVIDLKIDGQFGKIGRAAGHIDVVDVAVVLGDHGRD